MWLAVNRGAPYRTGATMAVVGHSSVLFVSYPISEVGEDGLCYINWTAYLLRNEMFEREHWSREGPLEDFLDLFED